MDHWILALTLFVVAIEIVGIVRRNPLALWVAEVLVMGAVFAVVRELFGVKGHIRGYTGRPRIRR